MTSHMRKKHNKKVKNVKNKEKAAYIHFQLKRRGFTFQTIADDLNISHTAVCRSVSDLSTISRVDDWIKTNLGIEV